MSAEQEGGNGAERTHALASGGFVALIIEVTEILHKQSGLGEFSLLVIGLC